MSLCVRLCAARDGRAVHCQASTQLVLSVGAGTHIFTMDRSTGEYLLTHQDLAIPERGASYSVNDGRCDI